MMTGITAEEARHFSSTNSEYRKKTYIRKKLLEIDNLIKQAACDGSYSISLNYPLHDAEIISNLKSRGYKLKKRIIRYLQYHNRIEKTLIISWSK